MTHWHLRGLDLRTLAWIWASWARAQIEYDKRIDFDVGECHDSME